MLRRGWLLCLTLLVLAGAVWSVGCLKKENSASGAREFADGDSVKALGAREPGRLGDTFIEELSPGVKLEMVYIPGGTFWMGSPETEAGRDDSEGPRHQVRVSPFWMGKFEVRATLVRQWLMDWRELRRRAAGEKPDRELSEVAERAVKAVGSEDPYCPFTTDFNDPDQPVVTMTAYGAQQFCRWLSARTGRYYRLPTEAEWEYACRAGTQTAYFFGGDRRKLEEFACFGEEVAVRPVGQKKPNQWGLHDMYGNVAEYVLDGWIENYRPYAGKVSVDVWDAHREVHRAVVRGGSVRSKAAEMRSGARDIIQQWYEGNDDGVMFDGMTVPDTRLTGFRVVSPVRKEEDGRASCIPKPDDRVK